MTDKELLELLELAAKAVGYDLKFSQEWHDKDEPQIKVTRGKWVGRVSWNPLESDDDAFRLMVKLHMLDTKRLIELRLEETQKDPKIDDCQILRRSIVRAAAEIGKGM